MAFSGNDMINGYTRDELFQLTNNDLRNVTERGWQKGPQGTPVSPEEFSRAAQGAFGLDTKAAFRETMAAEAEFSLNPPAPTPKPSSQYAATTWGGNDEYDFRTPSGQLCLIRKIDTERLVEAGILSKVTRLSGLVQQGIDTSEGKPPVKGVSAILDEPEKAREVIEVINALVVSLVVQPQLYVPVEGKPAPAGAINVNKVQLGDRIAIMEEAMGGVTKLDAFRN